MNLSDDADLESRLARLSPAGLPDDLRRQLRAAEPLPPNRWWQAALRPWAIAYAGLLATWLLILTLRLATPPVPTGAAWSPASARIPLDIHHPPTSLGSLSLDRTTLLTRNNLFDPWP